MTAEAMDDLAIILAIRELNAKEEAPLDADPSIFAPWGQVSYPEGYKSGKCDRPD